MLLLARLSVIQRLDDPVVVGIVLLLTVFGARSGLFRATLAGLQIVVSLYTALATCRPVGALLAEAEIPDNLATATGFVLVFLGVMAAVRIAIDSFIPEGAVRFPIWIDLPAGGVAGFVAGLALAGGIHLAWSMPPLPEDYRIATKEVSFRVGELVLEGYASFAGVDRHELLERYHTGQWDGPLSRPSGEPSEEPPEEPGEEPPEEPLRSPGSP